jgi:myo-inositol-1(or 4)-monophosphatase
MTAVADPFANDPLDLLAAYKVAERAARAAGAHLQASRSRLNAVALMRKQPGDLASEIDHEAEQLIHDVVRRAYPGHAFLGEESGRQEAVAAGNGEPPLWVVDPLDGTANYLRGYPQYAVSVALVVGGEPVVGTILDPCRNEFFAAIRGRGARLNGAALQCAERARPIDALAATVFPKPTSPRMASYLGEFGRVLRSFGGVRRSGSMALELAYLAAGRIDAFWEHDMGAWDAAAGIVLLREAGAGIEARDGRPLLESRSLAASTPAMREAFAALLSQTG